MRKQHAALKFLAMLVLLCTISAALASCGSNERKPEFYSGSTKNSTVWRQRIHIKGYHTVRAFAA